MNGQVFDPEVKVPDSLTENQPKFSHDEGEEEEKKEVPKFGHKRLAPFEDDYEMM